MTGRNRKQALSVIRRGITISVITTLTVLYNHREGPCDPSRLCGKEFFIKTKLIFLCFPLVYCSMREVKGKFSEIESDLAFFCSTRENGID